jgi:hypothetical protein
MFSGEANVAMRSKKGFGVASAMVLASLALALAPGVAQAKCDAKSCCHKPDVWTKVCVKQVGVKTENGKVVNLGHCGKWKSECVPEQTPPK